MYGQDGAIRAGHAPRRPPPCRHEQALEVAGYGPALLAQLRLHAGLGEAVFGEPDAVAG